MKRLGAAILLVIACLLATAPVLATDVDGPDDCTRQIFDRGDAPEGVLAYPGVPGNFPTCTAPGGIGTQTFVCPPLSTPPGPTGFVLHSQFGLLPGNHWLGCFGAPAVGMLGIDSDGDGKTNNPAVGSSACAPGLATDCVEAAYGMSFDQDECTGDGSDAGLRSPLGFTPCGTHTVTVDLANCGPSRVVFLNVLLDMNGDGDWNDNFPCPGACAHEWVVKNAPIPLVPGCSTITSPPFLVGPQPGRGWLRISTSDEPMPDDFPWNGTVSITTARGGETEDYPAIIDTQIGVEESTWGKMKKRYR